MRTTVELTEEQRALLHAIAARRGWRGYSRVVREAIDFYLQHHAEGERARRELLRRKGTWSAQEAERVRQAIKELRAAWSEAEAGEPAPTPSSS